MSTLGRTRLRLAADAASFDAPLDVLRRATPQFWRGNDVQFELGLFFNGALLDVSNLASLTLEVRPLGANGGPPDPSFTPLMGETVTSLDNTMTLDDWNSGAKQHAVLAFSAAESNIAAGSAWFSIFAITNDSPGRVITLCAGPVRILEDGAGLATTPVPAAETFYTAAQCDARFAAAGAGGEGGAPASDSNPLMDGSATAGTATAYARADHVHPTDTSRAAAAHASQHGVSGSDPVTLAQSQVTGLTSALAALAPLASPAFTGTPTAPTVATATDSSTKVATTAFVQAAITAAGAGGGGTWGSITGTLSSQTDLNTALADKAPLASPTFTGTVTIPTVAGTSDNSTKAASTAFVQAVLATIPTLPAVSGGTAGKILSNDGSTVSWASPGFFVDGDGNTIFNGTTPISVQYGDGSVNANFNVYGCVAAYSTTGLHKVVYDANNTLDVLLIQKNGTTEGGAPNGQSAIDFLSSKDIADDYDGTGFIKHDAIYGAVGFDPSLSSNVPSNGRMYLSFSPGFQAPDFTLPTAGVGAFVLQQEGVIGGVYKAGYAWACNNDWSISRTDPARNEQFRMHGVGDSGYYDTNWTQVDDSNHYWGTPMGVTIRQTSHESKEMLIGIRSSNFTTSGYEVFGPSKGFVGTTAGNGLSLYASAGPMMFTTGGFAAANERFRIDSSGNFIASNVVASDLSATLANSQYQFTVYDDGSSPVFKIRYKNASGAVKTGTVALS
ncbi:MAG TPA: hypothetical protein VHC95_06310 [Opitutales bacterium]|nr:hypothetical protein [Opitutales bacterium]